MEKEMINELIKRAIRVSGNAYAPYSLFKVGAAILTYDGFIFEGCNVENASFGATLCAERVAVGAMTAAGLKGIEAIAVASDKKIIYPCGICRQVIAEFIDDADRKCIICAKSQNEYEIYSLNDLFPKSFSPSDLK